MIGGDGSAAVAGSGVNVDRSVGGGRSAVFDQRSDKLASQIARQIEADIIRRGWPVGASLGSEQALQQQYGVSRSVFREAVRLVEHHQVASMRRGPNGGLFVTAPDVAPATRAIVIYLEYLGTSIDELLDARVVLEPLAASLAAEHIDEARIERLRDILRQEQHRRPAPALAHDLFHVVLGELSNNAVLQLFIDVLMRLTARYAQVARTAPAEAEQFMQQTYSEHSKVVEAIIGGDAALAKALSVHHIEAVSDWLNQHQRPRRSGKARKPKFGSYLLAEPQGKRAEVLAAKISDDIAAAGWQTGTVFGTEIDLLDQYRVSRAVLREAVRLLEYHNVTRMRRGPGGGLVIGTPQARASIDTIALYLEYRKPSREDLELVRDAVELVNIAKVVKRRDDTQVKAFLDARRADILQVSSGAVDLRRTSIEEFVFHTGLASLAGNSVLELFLRILVELFRRHLYGGQQSAPSPDDVVKVHHAHVKILDAIIEGDNSLAQHRARRHLQAVASWWL